MPLSALNFHFLQNTFFSHADTYTYPHTLRFCDTLCLKNLTLLVIGKITTYLFYSKFRLKVTKMPLSALKFHFLQITFFRREYAYTYTYPHTFRFSDTLCLKNALYTFFFKLLFFCSLLLLLTPETLPNHLFRQTNLKN